MYSGTPLIRKLVIRIANYSERLGPSLKPFLNVTVLYITLWLKFFRQLSNTYKELCINDLFVHK